MLTKEMRKKLLARKKKLKDSGKGSMLFLKADTTLRIRVLPVEEGEEPAREIMHFYFNKEQGGIVSPKSVGLPCPILEKYEELKDSKDEDDTELAAKIRPKIKFVVPCIVKKDKKGKEVDKQTGIRLFQITKGVYQSMIDLFLEPEQGDFTDPKKGYDLKVTRTGSGMTDTEYSVVPCQPSPLPKEYNKVVNLEEMLTKEIPSYDDAKAALNKFLGIDDEEEDEDETPKQKRLRLKKKKERIAAKKLKKKKKLG